MLAIVHQPDAGPGVFAEAIDAAGAHLDEYSPPAEPAPPRAIDAYDAVIALGGEVDPDQDLDHPWLATERRQLEQLLRTRVPVLGVCLGAQLLAQAAGGTAGRTPNPEIGWCEVRAGDAAADDPLIGPLRPRFAALEWHGFEFSLPPRAKALAHSDDCLQAFRLGGAAWGIQFHAEVIGDDLDRWIDEFEGDRDALRAESRGKIADWNEFGRALCRRFLEVAHTRS